MKEPNVSPQAQLMWQKAKGLLLISDGAATEIFVVGLNIERLASTIEEIRLWLREPEILSIAYASLETSIPLTSENVSTLAIEPDRLVQHSIRGTFHTEKDVCFYLWVNGPEKTFEVEITFWNDLHFPKEHSTEQHLAMFTSLIDISEKIRGDSEQARCILSPEHNGPIEELFGRDGVVEW